MKKIRTLICLITSIINLAVIAQSQNATVSFAARYYGFAVPLDSVLVKNINRNCDTMLYAPDTTPVLYYTVGTNEKNRQKTVLRFRRIIPIR